MAIKLSYVFLSASALLMGTLFGAGTAAALQIDPIERNYYIKQNGQAIGSLYLKVEDILDGNDTYTTKTWLSLPKLPGTDHYKTRVIVSSWEMQRDDGGLCIVRLDSRKLPWRRTNEVDGYRAGVHEKASFVTPVKVPVSANPLRLAVRYYYQKQDGSENLPKSGTATLKTFGWNDSIDRLCD